MLGKGTRVSLKAIRQWIRVGNGLTWLPVLAVGILLAGCSSTQKDGVSIVDRNHSGATSAPQRQPVTSGQYRVQRGDTLYSIAFRFGWDWKALAARNSIPAPYVIRPGQIIRFDGQPSQARPTTVATAPVVTNSRTGSSATSTRPPVQPQQPAVRPQSQAPQPVATAPVSTQNASITRSAAGWVWPASGPLIGRFSSNGSLNKGIDIAGELGQPVLAASDGSVVYAGSGLRGYGELVIIKHSDTYVSAYGHNRRLLVREGQQVKVGQTIAEMGSTGTDRVKLHFEIRRQGKPVDPLQYLPRR
ncbi:LysM peptidoglycan-binding domain-containing protein [Pseudomonas sp. DY-1]|nr:LysM peptidoglycan-binding domain-containing protein [Pseudomonas sp. DY-1]MDH4653072.1 LysM peptidoglycan-binding domain-containing protein [Pseudomonas sp. BN606]MRK22847.1 peptidoglycan DD-metalloendopeptidase family protein [Pseudomonas sp. JG-B]